MSGPASSTRFGNRSARQRLEVAAELADEAQHLVEPDSALLEQAVLERRGTDEQADQIARVRNDLIRKIGAPEDREHRLHPAERIRAGGNAPERRPPDVPVRDEGRMHSPDHVLDLFLPGPLVGQVGEVDLAQHVVEHQLDEHVLGIDVGVERGGADPEFVRDTAEGDGLEALGVEHAHGGLHDGGPVEPALPDGAGAALWRRRGLGEVILSHDRMIHRSDIRSRTLFGTDDRNEAAHESPSPPLADPVRHPGRRDHGSPRRNDRERRSAHDPPSSALFRGGPAVDRGRLLARPRDRTDRRRADGRPLRPSSSVRDRRPGLHGLLARVRALRLHVDARGVSPRAGRLRGLADPAGARDHARDLPEGRAAEGVRAVRAGDRRRGRARTDHRRPAGERARARRLAADLLRQRAARDRHRDRRGAADARGACPVAAAYRPARHGDRRRGDARSGLSADRGTRGRLARLDVRIARGRRRPARRLRGAAGRCARGPARTP